ncbi:MAG: alkaline phosphatase family protein [Terracidiphilus sp.]
MTDPCCKLAALLLAFSTPAFANVKVSSPASGSTVTSPVQYVATATASSCSKGVSAIGIYVSGKLVYSTSGTSLNTALAMTAGSHTAVVEETDNCGKETSTSVKFTVKVVPEPTVAFTVNPLTVTAGSSSVLSVAATNTTALVITGSDGSSYKLAPAGGTQTVTPVGTTTYTAEATGAKGSVSAEATVSVIPTTSLNAINHVVFMLQENHSFDNYFGMLNPYREANGWNVSEDGNTYTVDGIDDKLTTIMNKDDQGLEYPLFKMKSTCIDDDSSAWEASYGDVSRYDFLTSRPILMDGFVHTAEGFATACNEPGSSCSGQFTDVTGERAMGYYDQEYLNYYYYMASQFAVSDRWFSPVASKSIDNRIATFTGGTTQGLVQDPGSNDHLTQLAIETIFNELDKAKVSWKIYYTVTQGFCLNEDECTGSAYDKYPATDFGSLSYSFNYLRENHGSCIAPMQPSGVVGDPSNSFCVDPDHIAPLSQYFSDVANGTLPSFAFIEAGYANNDEHPGSGQSVLNGQAQVAKVVNALMASPSWGDSVFFFGYDEGGGPYDHVPPVPGHSNENTDASLGSIPDIASISVNPDTYFPCLPVAIPPATKGIPTTHCDLDPVYPGAHAGDAPTVYGFGAQLGFRVPNIVISPFTRKHYVSHTPMDHTAVIKFVENRFLGPTVHLTARDAAQSNLLEFFDFTNTPWSTPPTPPTPVSSASLGFNPCTPTSLK